MICGERQTISPTAPTATSLSSASTMRNSTPVIALPQDLSRSGTCSS
jgi:hypothetical protein